MLDILYMGLKQKKKTSLVNFSFRMKALSLQDAPDLQSLLFWEYLCRSLHAGTEDVIVPENFVHH